MMTRDQLAEWLQRQNVEALSATTGLSTKTIYRLRGGKKSPSFSTLQKLLAAGAAPAKTGRKHRAEPADTAKAA